MQRLTLVVCSSDRFNHDAENGGGGAYDGGSGAAGKYGLADDRDASARHPALSATTTTGTTGSEGEEEDGDAVNMLLSLNK